MKLPSRASPRVKATDASSRHAWRRALPALATATVALITGATTALASGAKVEVNIARGYAHSRLNDFMAQTGCVVTHNVDALVGVETQAVQGRVSPTRALNEMFRDTEFYGTRISAPCSYALVRHRRPRAVSANARRHVPETTDEPAEVVITGSYVRAKPSASVDLVRISREDLASGSFATLNEVIRVLPQAHGAGPSEDTQLGSEAPTNITLGSGINLRGLNAGATLLLVDGGRVGASGSKGAFSDISGIPLSAIERVEVLTNGTSAIYGADAVGGVVNVIMRKQFVGSESAATWGRVTEGPMKHLALSQLVGGEWGWGGGYVAMEYFTRGALPDTARSQWTSDLRKLGGDAFNSRASNPGTLIAGGNQWAIPRGQDGTQLSQSQLAYGEVNERDRQDGVDALPAHEVAKAYTSSHFQLFDRTELQATASFSQRRTRRNAGAAAVELPVPATNPFYLNPTGGVAPVTVAYSFMDDLGTMFQDIHVDSGMLELGLTFKLGVTWQIRERVRYAMELGHSRTNNVPGSNALIAALADTDPATALNVYGDGSHTNPATLEAIRTSELTSYESRIRDASLELSGNAGDLGGGPLRMALGANKRVEYFVTKQQSEDRLQDWWRYGGREVTSVYGELAVPVVDAAHQRPWLWLKQLEFSAALRTESHSDVGRSTTPRLRVLMSPLPQLQFSASWALASLAPNLGTVRRDNWSTVMPVLDGQSAVGSSVVMIRFGNNPDLKAETASSFTIGATLNPGVPSGLQLAASYFSIDVSGRAAAIPYSYSLLNDPAYASRITRSPSSELLSEICQSSEFLRGDAEQCMRASVDAVADLRTQNVVRQQTRGVDFAGRYKFSTVRGVPTIGSIGTYVTDYLVSEGRGAPYVERAGTEHNPPAFRFRSSFDWKPSNFGASAHFNFSSAYRDTSSRPERSVSSWRTVDFQVFFESGSRDEDDGSGLRVSLNVLNAFNTLPPFLNNSVGVGYDQENADLTGRMVRLTLRKRF